MSDYQNAFKIATVVDMKSQIKVLHMMTRHSLVGLITFSTQYLFINFK
jgi:hypothetical protein